MSNQKEMADAVSLNDRDFAIACGVLDDRRALIAAGKTQRWEVLKWAVTVNTAIAALSAAQGGTKGGALTFLAVFIAAIGIVLVEHYNARMTAARLEADHVLSLFHRSGIDLDSITPQWQVYANHPHLKTYDWQELFAFRYAIGGSAIPALLAWAFAR